MSLSDLLYEYSLAVGGQMANKNGKKRLNLKQEARDILEDYFLQVSQSPSGTEAKALVEKIKAIPECGDYDMARMVKWFSRRRSRLRLKEAPDPRFPSLTLATIQHLTVLASNQPHPSPELVKTWATLLARSGANEQDVTNWIQHRNQEQHFSTPMTPESSMSPTSPTESTSPVYKQEATMSPVSPTLQLYPQEHARASPSEPPPTTSDLNNDPKSTSVPNSRLQDPALQAIIHGVHDALANPQITASAAPKTAAEFEAMFSPFEQQILLLIRALETT